MSKELRLKDYPELIEAIQENGYTTSTGGFVHETFQFFPYSLLKMCGCKVRFSTLTEPFWFQEEAITSPLYTVGKLCSVWDEPEEYSHPNRTYEVITNYKSNEIYPFRSTKASWAKARVVSLEEFQELQGLTDD